MPRSRTPASEEPELRLRRVRLRARAPAARAPGGCGGRLLRLERRACLGDRGLVRLRDRVGLRRRRRARAAPGISAKSPASTARLAGVYSAAAGCSTGSSRTARGPIDAHLDLPADPRDRRLVLAQQPRGEVAERDDDRRLDQLELAVEPARAVGDLRRRRVAVVRRAALEDVGDEDVLARDPDLRRAAGSAACPARPTNGTPSRSSSAPGRLADEQEVRVGVPGAEDDLRAGLREVRAAARRRGPRGRPPRAPRGGPRRCPGRPSGAMLPALRRLPSAGATVPGDGAVTFRAGPRTDRTPQAHLRPRPVSRWGTGPTPLHASPSSAQAVSARRSPPRSRAAGLTVDGPHGRGSDGAGADAVLLCVPDAQIPVAAAAVRPGRLVGHCSGATGLGALAGHEAFGLHPLMTVTARRRGVRRRRLRDRRHQRPRRWRSRGTSRWRSG